MIRVALIACLIAGCAQAAQPPQHDAPFLTYRPGFDTARIVSEDRMVVRTFTSASADRKEYAGALCHAVSTELVIEFRSPAVLTIPRIRQRPSDLLIRCASPIGIGRTTVRPGQPDHFVGFTTPFLALATATLAAWTNGKSDHWSYVPRGALRRVTLDWKVRP